MLKGQKIHIELNVGKCKKLDAASIMALRKTADELKGEVIDAQVMPFRTGTMQNTATFVDETNVKQGKVSITTSTPYARRMYYHPEYNFRTDQNPNARGLWFEPWLPGGDKEKRPQEVYSAMLKREAGL